MISCCIVTLFETRSCTTLSPLLVLDPALLLDGRPLVPITPLLTLPKYSIGYPSDPTQLKSNLFVGPRVVRCISLLFVFIITYRRVSITPHAVSPGHIGEET
jgi:hypothetical protein